MTSAEALTLVTVVFEAEIPLLELQARSMAVWLPPDLVHDIVVIDNTDRGLRERDRRELVRRYGPLAERVTLLRPSDIVDDVPPTTGWVRQQILKLEVAKTVRTSRYVVLDAKNHFIASPTMDFFVDHDGRARIATYSYEDHPLRHHLESVLRYLDLPADHVHEFTATITPFVLDTDVVTAMIADVEQRSGRRFPEEFVERGLTEFFLYSAWRVAQGDPIDRFVAPDSTRCPVVWPRHATLEGVDAAVRQAADDHSPLFSVHRRALATLDGSAARRLATMWASADLFPSASQARRFIRAFRIGLARSHLTKRLDPRRVARLRSRSRLTGPRSRGSGG